MFVAKVFQVQLSWPSVSGRCSGMSFYFIFFKNDSESKPSCANLFIFNLVRDLIFTIIFGWTNYCLLKKPGGGRGVAGGEEREGRKGNGEGI